MFEERESSITKMFKNNKIHIDFGSYIWDNAYAHAEQLKTKTQKMRTKALILSAAIVAAGVASSMAQSNVYSLNVVGYVNVTLKSGFNLVSVPLDNGSNNLINNILDDGAGGLLPDGCTLYPWSGHTYGALIGYAQHAGWTPDGSALATNSLPPGTAFFISLPQGSAATTVTFVGSVVQGTTTTTVLPGYNLIGPASAVANYAGFTSSNAVDADLGSNSWHIPANDSDFLLLYTNGVGYRIWQFIGNDGLGDPYGWNSGDPVNAADNTTNGPSIPVASGFFLQNTHTGVTNTWTQNFIVQ